MKSTYYRNYAGKRLQPIAQPTGSDKPIWAGEPLWKGGPKRHMPKGGKINTVELCYNVLKGTEYCVVITAEYNVMVNNGEFIRTTENLTL